MARRLLMVIPVMLGVSIVVFIVLTMTGDPTLVILGQHATPEQQAALRQSLGLNDPIYVQYGRFLWQAVHGDLGRSWLTETPVVEEVLARFPHTVELTLLAMVISTIVGVVVGIISAVRQYSWFDHLSMIGALIGVSTPIFWLGLIFISIFSMKLGWLPVAGRIDLTLGFEPKSGFYVFEAIRSGQWAILKDLLKHIILPAVALAAYSMGLVARMTRSSLLETIRQDYVRTARAKGLAERVVVLKHALKNALIPVITVVGLQFGYLLSGAVLTETIFSWPGVGSLAVNAVQNADMPLVEGCVLLVSLVFVLVNLVVDVTYAFADPRIRYS
ncbi:MAG TPA: ABC transporter permease [Bacillota bacterium]